MPNYNRIIYHWVESKAILENMVEQFLMPLCDTEMEITGTLTQEIFNYQHVIRKMPESWQEWLRTQYIAYQIFRKDGLASKYLHHFQVRRRSVKELNYLKFQIEHPWRFVFCKIVKNPCPDFFQMQDILTGDEFLLYSPGITDTEGQLAPISLYFLLIGFTGDCWHIFGSVAYFKGIQPFDLLYFAKQLKPDLVSIPEIQELIAKDPIPFMMLWVGGEYTFNFYNQEMTVITNSTFQLTEFDQLKFTGDFIINKLDEPPVYMLSLKDWHGVPHFSKCFYDMDQKRLWLSAMTERGYAKLTDVLNKMGYYPNEKTVNRATPAMISIVEEIFEKEIELNPYEKLFVGAIVPDIKTELRKIHTFLEKLSDALEVAKEFDLRELANLAGIEPEVAQKIWNKLINDSNLHHSP